MFNSNYDSNYVALVLERASGKVHNVQVRDLLPYWGECEDEKEHGAEQFRSFPARGQWAPRSVAPVRADPQARAVVGVLSLRITTVPGLLRGNLQY